MKNGMDKNKLIMDFWVGDGSCHSVLSRLLSRNLKRNGMIDEN